MPTTLDLVQRSRQQLLYAAKALLSEAIDQAELQDNVTADAYVVTVLRVLDSYEAVAQLPDAHDIASEPDKPIPFHPVR